MTDTGDVVGIDLAALFPPFVRTAVVTVGAAPDPQPGEAVLVADAAERRRQIFAAGREAAHRALRALGAPDGPILRRPDGSPEWPAGVVGSIAHTDRLAAAAVAWTADADAIGLDVEIAADVTEDLSGSILAPGEEAAWRRLPAERRAADLALRFCAKEAVWKCLAHAARPREGLRGIVIDPDEDGGFRPRGTGPDAIQRLDGRYAFDRATGHVIAAVVRLRGRRTSG